MAQSLAQFESGTLTRWLGARLRLTTRVEMFIARTLQHTLLTVKQRVRMAGQFLLDRTRVNLSRPVRKITTRLGRTAVDPNSRSKPGEFPRADTTRLLKDVFLSISEDGLSARVGTTLEYGLILELKLNRSFLRRTFNELREQMLTILQGGGSVGV